MQNIKKRMLNKKSKIKEKKKTCEICNEKWDLFKINKTEKNNFPNV